MKSKTIKYSSIKLAGLAAAGILFLAASQANATSYAFHDLGTAGGPWSMALAINNAGQITGGNSRGTPIRDDGEILTIWDGATMTTSDLDSRGWSINSSGAIAGGYADRGFWFFASTWNAAGVRTDLEDLAGRKDEFWSVGQGINDLGQVVGAAVAADNNSYKPLLWDNSTTPTVLDTLGGQTGEALGINNAGLAVGNSFTTGDAASHATLWDINSGSVTDLGTLGGIDSNALAINQIGQIAGWSYLTGDLAQHATFWDGAALTDLGTLGGTNSSALALNNLGQVVGWSELADGSQHAMLWDGATLIDLNSLLDPALVSAGWVLKEAAGINDHGAIVGTAVNDLLGITNGHAFLLSPVPEPETYAMLLAGLGLMGAMARRRKVTVKLHG
jgi:probable HAF family extracellular repeat protein